MEESAAAESLEISEVFQRLRSQTGQLLEDGATPSEVSFALAYIAAELGFVVSDHLNPRFSNHSPGR